MKTPPPLNPRAQKSARQETESFAVFPFAFTHPASVFPKSSFFLPQTPPTYLCGWPRAGLFFPGALPSLLAGSGDMT